MRSFVVLTALALATSDLAAQRARLARPSNLRPDQYVVDFVSTAAFGVDMNRAGDVVGTSYLDLGCGPFCLPPLETVVWRAGQRIVLPSVPGLSGITVRAINDAGWIVGLAGFPYTTTHAVLWREVGGVYKAFDLGTLPGTTTSEAVGIDERGRVIGWSTTLNFPPNGSPFLWSQEAGLVDLSQLGFPDEFPLAISPGGTVATASSWYRLDDPASVTPLAPPPAGFAVGNYATAINDAGDQARFLVRISGQNLVYLFRYHHEGVWQQISPTPTGHLSSYGVGSIDEKGDVTATVASTGVIARGPAGLAQPLAAMLAAPFVYPDSASTPVTRGGPMNTRGEILAQVMLGRSPRLVRLEPAPTCEGACMEVAELDMTAVFVPDPSAPGSCAQTLSAHNQVFVILRVTTPTGSPLQGALVSGRFLDDYWTDHLAEDVTDASGQASFNYTGLCGVGAIEFLVDQVRAGGLDLDQTMGRLSVWEIPR